VNLKPALQLRHDNAAYSVAFSTDAGLLATGSLDKSIRIWELPSGVMKFQMKGHGEAICNVVFQNANQSLLSAGLDRTLRTWNLATGKMQSTMIKM
jgi:WD40 repeat protein